jgi:hypothetical protein
LLFGHKNRLQVDMGDLKEEKEHLTSFLHTNLKSEVTSIQNKLIIDSEELTSQELQRIVTKFVYKRNLNATHYVSLDGSTIRINEFKSGNKKPEKRSKNPTPPHMAHGF